ncbi:MAG: blue light receptor [Chrysothrix sp. TS-e1954]|nr:MAG: blue light receptor [Chrysothrix sp. TS-e1954]
MDQYRGRNLTGDEYTHYGQSEDQSEDMYGVEMSSLQDMDMFGRQPPDQGSQSISSQNISQGPRRSSQDQNMNAQIKQQNPQQSMQQFEGQMPSSGGTLNNFQFAPSSMMNQNVMNAGAASFALNSAGLRNSRQNSMSGFSNQTPNNSSFAMFSPMAAYSTSMNANGHGQMGMQGTFIPQAVPMAMDFSDPNVAAMMRNGMVPMSMMHQGQFLPPNMVMNNQQSNQNQQQQNHVSANTASSSMAPSDQDPPLNADNRNQMMSNVLDRTGMHFDQPTQQSSQNFMSEQTMRNMQSVQDMQNQVNRMSNTIQAQQRQQQMQQFLNGSDGNSMSWPGDGQQSQPTMAAQPAKAQVSYANAYSSTGFDMLQVLMRLATRKNPEIQLGAVDLSCAFVVCDALEHDFPIVYCSENFERLTGYTKHEILGRNCRFLQAPDGKVQAGVKRSYVDDDSVLYLKNAINSRKEAQVNLINYRKGGQPFMNLLTLIPLSYDSDDTRFFVGLQVDLVEQPNSVTNKNPDGSYKINYQRGLTMPRYVFTGDEKRVSALESAQTISRDEVSNALSAIGAGESEQVKRLWDKVLLENADDVIFVLSLKGLFLFLSPSSKTALEYDANELMGTALSSVCHPSDIVPVTRELKDTTTTSSVDVVFRIRRKVSGYMWFEAHGALHTEQGKGRKSIVLVGRERPVYTLSRPEILASGGLNDQEFWTKLSTSGMFLFVSSNIRTLLDKLPSEVVGTSIRSLMLQDSYSDFVRAMEVARSGRRATAKHELMNKRGQVLQAFSTLYPGDAKNGRKPTFFVAQTRLLKYSRSSAATAMQRNQTATANAVNAVAAANTANAANAATTAANIKQERRTSDPTIHSVSPVAGSAPAASRPTSMSRQSSGSLPSPSRYMSTFESAATYPGQQGLALGHQDVALASVENLFDELKTTRSTSWQFELRQMEKRNRLLAEELQSLLAARKKRKRRRPGELEKDCANCHTKTTPEWRRGPSGHRDLCNSCGLRWAKQQGRISPRTSSQRSAQSHASDKQSGSPLGPLANQSPTQHAHAATPSVGDIEGDSSGPKSIDEALADFSPTQPQGPPSDGGASSQHVSKSAKMTESPSMMIPTAVPMKIEEVDAEAEAG